MTDGQMIEEGFLSLLALKAAVREAELAHGVGAFDPRAGFANTPEERRLREAGERLFRWRGRDGMRLATKALVRHDPRGFYGLVVLLDVMWRGIGDELRRESGDLIGTGLKR